MTDVLDQELINWIDTTRHKVMTPKERIKVLDEEDKLEVRAENNGINVLADTLISMVKRREGP